MGCPGTRYAKRDFSSPPIEIDLGDVTITGGAPKPGFRRYYNLKLLEPNVEYSLDDLQPPVSPEERETICGIVVDHSYNCGPLRLALDPGIVVDPMTLEPFKEIPPESEYELIQQFQQIYFASECPVPDNPVCVLIEIIFEAEDP